MQNIGCWSDEREGRWLLAESSWAEVSVVPRFVNLVHWIWKVSTCLMVLQFVIPMQRHCRLAKRAKKHAAEHPELVGLQAESGATRPTA